MNLPPFHRRPRPLAPETTSGVYKALTQTRQHIKWGSIAAGVVLVGTIAGGVMAGIAVAQSAADAGVKVTNERVTLVRDELSRHVTEEAAARLRTESKVDRVEVKTDAVLDALRVPMWKRPERADGGSQ